MCTCVPLTLDSNWFDMHYRFIPIVMLALVFNVSNAVGFTYAYVKFKVSLSWFWLSSSLHIISGIVTRSKNGLIS